MQGEKIMAGWEFTRAIYYLVAQGLRLPHGQIPWKKYRTKAEWDTLQWNPPQYMERRFPEADPNASTKPTWDEVWDALRAWLVEDGVVQTLHNASGQATFVINRLADSHVQAKGRSIYVGKGIDAMSGLVHLHSKSGDPGEHLPSVVMRDQESAASIRLWRRRDLDDMMERVTENRNLGESAKNQVLSEVSVFVQKANAAMAQYRDKTRTAEQRQASLAEAERYKQQADDMADAAKVSARMDEIIQGLKSPDSLPTDPDEARDVLVERLAVKANIMRNMVLGAHNSQDAHLAEACIEQKEALEKITTIRQAGTIALFRKLGGWAALRLTYETYVKLLDTIRVRNTPMIRKMNGTSFPSIGGDGVKIGVDGDGVLHIKYSPTLGIPSKAGTPVDLLTFRIGNPTATSTRTTDEMGYVAMFDVYQDEQGEPWNGESVEGQHAPLHGDGCSDPHGRDPGRDR